MSRLGESCEMSSGLDRDYFWSGHQHQAISPRWVPPSLDVDFFPLVTEGVCILTACVLMGIHSPGLVVACALVFLSVAGTYRRRIILSSLDAAPKVIAATATAGLVASAWNGTSRFQDVLVTAAVLCTAALLGRLAGVAIERRLHRRGLFLRRAAIVGGGTVATSLIQRMLAEPECGLHPVALIDSNMQSGPGIHGDLSLHTVAGGLRSVVVKENIDTVIVAFPKLDASETISLIAECEGTGCDFYVVPRLWEISAIDGSMDRVGAIPLCRLDQPAQRTLRWRLKLAADRLLAGAALVALFPLLTAIAAAVYLSDRSAPVLFRQRRIGLHGQEFELLKFRSMQPATEVESQTTWSITGDSRLGPFSRLLRASSLDELPQLINIMRGDMALVGPRPERPHFVEIFSASIPGYAQRHRVPVGLTGWAAVNGLRGNTSIAERALYDNFYIVNWSLWFDIKILIRTGWAVIVNFQRDRYPLTAAESGGPGA